MYQIMLRLHIRTPIAIIISLALVSIPANAYGKTKSEIGPVADESKTPTSYLVVDAQSGKIVSSKNIHQPLNVASTSKIVTALAAVNTIGADQEITIPREAEQVQPMKIDMKSGQKWKRDDLLYSLLLVSANDAAYALANESAGSIEEFPKQQTRIAKELGMQDSTFGDPSGLDDSQAINGGTKMSAYDLAIASRALLAQPLLAKIVGTLNYQFVGGDAVLHTLTNHNDLFLNSYPGANGLKTGYTQKAGRTFIASATQNGTTLIAVVLGVQQTDEWAAKLLNGGFAAITNGSVGKNASTLPAIGVIGSKANLTILKSPANAAPIKNTSEDRNEFLSVPLVSLLILFLLTGLFFWRRRQIKRRKKLRLEKQAKARAASFGSKQREIDLTVDKEFELTSKR